MYTYILLQDFKTWACLWVSNELDLQRVEPNSRCKKGPFVGKTLSAGRAPVGPPVSARR